MIEVVPTTADKLKAYIGSADLCITLQAGKIEKIYINSTSGWVKLMLGKADEFTPDDYITIKQPPMQRRLIGKYLKMA